MDTAGLMPEARLDAILRIARERNPDLAEAGARARSSRARAKASGRLPDLEVKYEQWGVPLARPYALGDADTLMLGLRQSFPARGVRDARSRAAIEEAEMSVAAQAAREEDLVAEVRRGYFDYYRADREYRIHLEHVAIASDVVDLARVHYQAGRGTQQDVLRTMVELSRLHNDVASIEQHMKSARARLNALMARPPDAPLGVPIEATPSLAASLPADARTDSVSRPELTAAERAVRRSEASLDAARRAARFPALMVGADYWFMPNMQERHAYGAMVAISLPWLNPRNRDEARAADEALNADRRALESVRNVIAFEIRDASVHLEAASRSFTIIERDLLPQARQSFEAARAAFASGQGDILGLLDAQRSYLQVRLERSRALAALESSRADLDRALGRGRSAGPTTLRSSEDNR